MIFIELVVMPTVYIAFRGCAFQIGIKADKKRVSGSGRMLLKIWVCKFKVENRKIAVFYNYVLSIRKLGLDKKVGTIPPLSASHLSIISKQKLTYFNCFYFNCSGIRAEVKCIKPTCLTYITVWCCLELPKLL